MTPDSRTTVLFWCQVALYVTTMVLMLGILVATWYFVISGVRAIDESRHREHAMLQHHHTEMQAHERFLHDHDQARAQQADAFARTTQAFDALLHDHQHFMRQQGR